MKKYCKCGRTLFPVMERWPSKALIEWICNGCGEDELGCDCPGVRSRHHLIPVLEEDDISICDDGYFVS